MFTKSDRGSLGASTPRHAIQLAHLTAKVNDYRTDSPTVTPARIQTLDSRLEVADFAPTEAVNRRDVFPAEVSSPT